MTSAGLEAPSWATIETSPSSGSAFSAATMRPGRQEKPVDRARLDCTETRLGAAARTRSASAVETASRGEEAVLSDMEELLCRLRCRSLRALPTSPDGQAALGLAGLHLSPRPLYQRPHDKGRRSRLIRLALAVVFALLGAPAFADTIGRAAPQSPAQVRLSFAPVVKKAAPAVVNVYASRVETMPRNPLFDDPIFRRFFGGEGSENQRVQKALGSGVIVDPSGLVVTNHHVIEGMTDVKVALSDKREFEAQIVLRDPRSDLAVLKLTRAAGISRCSILAIPTRSKSATSSRHRRSRSASARPSPRASSRRWRAPRSGSTISASSSRPTPPSIRAIPAARWSITTASWSASIPRSIRARAAAWASASPFP